MNIDKEWKNYCVVDDSSKFAAAVYYHYINKKFIKSIANGYFYSDNYEDNNIPYTTIIRFIGEK